MRNEVDMQLNMFKNNLKDMFKIWLFKELQITRSTEEKNTCILSLPSQGEWAYNGRVEDKVWGVLGHST